jgi:manganese transport protein
VKGKADGWHGAAESAPACESQPSASALAPKSPAPLHGLSEVLRYVGPGFFVTIGFIDPGNWAANMAAGSRFGYTLLWVVTLSTLLLVVVQHNAAHLGIATGLCLSESATKHFPPLFSRALLGSAVLASMATAMAEILGAAIGIEMLLGVPTKLGSALVALAVGALIVLNGYARLEKWMIGFVSAVGLAFLFELAIASVDWGRAVCGAVMPSMPAGSIPLLASVLGAVVMPHGIFLHSEVIQSRGWHEAGAEFIRRKLKLEFLDTAAAMTVGWAINSAMIVMAAAVFHTRGLEVTELPQAGGALAPLLGRAAYVVFALALVASGFASSVTAAMAGGSIVAGLTMKPFDASERHSRWGMGLTLAGAMAAILLVKNAFGALIWSQVALSIQLPWTILALAVLTSSSRVMGDLVSPRSHRILLWAATLIVTVLNVLLLRDALG